MYLRFGPDFSFVMLPVGPNSMPCQLMVGFFAYANSFEIRVDKKELEGIYNHHLGKIQFYN